MTAVSYRTSLPYDRALGRVSPLEQLSSDSAGLRSTNAQKSTASGPPAVPAPAQSGRRSPDDRWKSADSHPAKTAAAGSRGPGARGLSPVGTDASAHSLSSPSHSPTSPHQLPGLSMSSADEENRPPGNGWAPERSTWASAMTVGTISGQGGRAQPRASTHSYATFDSAADPFQYSGQMYEAASEAADLPPPVPSSAFDPPTVHIGPPSPRELDFGPDVQTVLLPPSASMGSLSPAPASPALSEVSTASGRARSQTYSRNFSRPLAGSIGRSDSVDSHTHTDEDALQSSVGHSSSGGHSLSSSWEGRHGHELMKQRAWKDLSRAQPTTFYGGEPVVHTPAGPSHGSREENILVVPSNGRDMLAERHLPVDRRASGASEDPFAGYYLPADSPTTSTGTSTTAAPVPQAPPGPRKLRKARSRHDLSDAPASEKRSSWFRSSSKTRSRGKSVTASDIGSPLPGPSPGAFVGIGFGAHLPPVELDLDPDAIAERTARAEEAEREEARRQWAALSLRTSPAPTPSPRLRSSPRLAPGGEVERGDEVERLEERASPQPSVGQGSRRKASGGAGSRRGSKGSLYSNYSIYTLPPDEALRPGSSAGNASSRGPSPQASPQLASAAPQISVSAPAAATAATRTTVEKATAGLKVPPVMHRTKSGNNVPLEITDPQTVEDYLQLGITCHEAGRLEKAAEAFERSANLGGGCGAGMLLYGLSLRHGWGCPIDAERGFAYLQKAAQSVVEDLDGVVSGHKEITRDEKETKAAKNELVLALYEMGTSYRFGWGVVKDKKMAVAYFTLAADLGDQDAQQDLAFAYANGKGCKKDMKKAAKYYRLAVAQGGDSFGLSWIYKPKYLIE